MTQQKKTSNPLNDGTFSEITGLSRIDFVGQVRLPNPYPRPGAHNRMSIGGVDLDKYTVRVNFTTARVQIIRNPDNVCTDIPLSLCIFIF